MSKKSKAVKDTKYETRDVVLAKVRGYPPWPGMVVDPEGVSPDVLKERPRNKKAAFYCVRFFPKGDYAWLVSKDMSRLQTHEIQAYINEPYKRSGELLTSYQIALNPSKWEEEMETQRVEAAEAEANAEVDQLENETDDREADADGDADDDDKPKPKKRKRDSEVAASKAKVRAKAKKDSAEPAPKKKGAAGAKGRRNGTKSKAMVESEDDGERAEAEAEAEADEDEEAGPSKQTSPPPAKKAKTDDPAASDPEALKVREWRHKLQKTFLNENKDPKPEDMPGCDELFTTIEQYDNMNIQYLSFSKIGKVMRHIHMQPADKIPRDEEYHFRDRAKVLVEKWHVILNASKDSGAAKTNGVAKAVEEEAKAEEGSPSAKADDKMDEDSKPNGEDVKMAVEPEANGAVPDTVTVDADASVLADVTMSEA